MTLNEKIEAAWMNVRDSCDGLSVSDRRAFETRFAHIIADQLETTVERVRQRIRKIEHRH